MSVQFKGCNLTGGSTYWSSWPSTGPVSGQHYQFVSHAEVDALLAKGMNTFRLVFAWEALQAKEYEALGVTYPDYAAKLFDLVDYITGKGANVILDVHGDADRGFAAYMDVPVGSKTPSGQLVDDLLENLWWSLGTKYGANPRVWCGVTNEPHDIPVATWFAAAQKILNGWRKGSSAPVVMPGTAWTGAGSWVESGNAAGWNLVDPLNNTFVQLHLYLDQNSGGGAVDVVSPTIGVERMARATSWARAKGLKLFLGEVGMTAANGKLAWDNLMTYCEANSDVIIGWTWWAQGPLAWWGGYQFTLRNGAGGDTAQMAMVVPYLKPAVAPVDVSALTTKITSLTSDVTTLKAQISTLTTQTTSLIAQIAGLRSKIAAAQGALT